MHYCLMMTDNVLVGIYIMIEKQNIKHKGKENTKGRFYCVAIPELVTGR